MNDSADSPRVLVPLAEGCEPLEAVTIIDLLRRAEFDVVAAGLQAGEVAAGRGVRLIPDMSLEEALKYEYDMVALPGGLPGADHLASDSRLNEFLKRMSASGRFVAAICAAPKVLARSGLLEGLRATGYPGVLQEEGHANVTGEAVTRDGCVITSRAAGTAIDFALELIAALAGPELRDKVEASLVRTSRTDA